MRTTKEQLRRQIADLAERGFDLSIGWAYGRPRVSSKDGSRDISPRLPMGEMQIWLNGYQSATWDATRKGSVASDLLQACKLALDKCDKHFTLEQVEVIKAVIDRAEKEI